MMRGEQINTKRRGDARATREHNSTMSMHIFSTLKEEEACTFSTTQLNEATENIHSINNGNIKIN